MNSTAVLKRAAAVLALGLSACGGGGSSNDEPTPPPTGLSATESRAVALSTQSTPTGSLVSDQAFAASLVQGLQSLWLPAVREAATVYSASPSVQGPFDALGWTTAPVEQPPAEYGVVLASGAQVAARVYRCELAFDPTYAGDPRQVFEPVSALDALTAAQRSSLSIDQFTANLLGGVSANNQALRAVYSRPGQVTVGDASSLVMEQCEFRRFGSGLPATGQVTVTSGRVDTTLIAIVSADTQMVSSTLSVTTTSAGGPATSTAGTYFGYFAQRALVSLVKDDLRVFNGVIVTQSGTDSAVQQADMLVPVPGASATGSVPAPTLRVSYDQWAVSSATGRAVNGTVAITDSGSSNATIKPVAGGYEVRVTIGGVERTYTVAP